MCQVTIDELFAGGALTADEVKTRWTRFEPCGCNKCQRRRKAKAIVERWIEGELAKRAAVDDYDGRSWNRFCDTIQEAGKLMDKVETAVDLYQCDSCGQEVPSDQIKTGMAFGVEGRFCAGCRGEREDDQPAERCSRCDLPKSPYGHDVGAAAANSYCMCPPELWPGQPMPPAAPTCAESSNPVPYPSRPVIVVDTGRVR